MSNIKTIQIKSIVKCLIIAGSTTALIGCSMFRDREDDYLKTDVYQTQGIKVPESLEKTTTIKPTMQVPEGKDQYQPVKTMPTDLVPPNYQKQYPLALLKNLQAQSAESSLTFVKGKYGLLVIDTELNKAYEIVAKELTSIPDFEIVKQSRTGHSFEVVSVAEPSKKYWLYLTAKDKKTRLSVFDQKENLVADDEVYALLTQLNSRIQALYQGGDSDIQIQYPLKQLQVTQNALTWRVLAPMPESLAYFKVVLQNLGYVLVTKDNLTTITVTMPQVNQQNNNVPVKERFSLNVAEDKAFDITDVTLKPMKASKDTQKHLQQLSNQINAKAKETFITKEVSLLSVSSQLFIDESTNKAALIVPLAQAEVWPKVEQAVKASKYHIIRSDKDKGFFFIALKEKTNYQYLVYVRNVDTADSTSISQWLTFGLLTSDQGSKTYVQVFDKDGHIMPIEQTKTLLLTLQNNL
ncbi:MAG: hypothetical protein EP298_08110 [Gammaproteobacteria bacterium]|nr:MAG: hypothetical protein EP298_08110 [Gammaproteobacteria bacterium]UTW42908.1 hypothetical protein KFE69_01850 [bacterium SCSIO 12844]